MGTKDETLDKLLWVYYPSGLILIFMSILVLSGWYLGISSIVQIHPTFVPMQYNTALCFLFLGLGSVCYAHSNKKISEIFGLLVFVIAGLTLLEYLIGKDLGIDYFFFGDNRDGSGPPHGRMAFNTSICFVISSILLILCDFRRSKITIAIKQLLSAIIVAISGLSLYGYLIGSESATVWADISRMAVHTAFGFFIYGLTFFIFKLIISFKLKLYGIAAPISMALMSTMISIGVLKAFNSQEDHQIQHLTSEFTTYLSKKIETSFASDLMAINRMAERWPAYRDMPRQYWNEDVNNYYRDIPSINEIQIKNSSELRHLFDTHRPPGDAQQKTWLIDKGQGMLSIIVMIPENNLQKEYLFVSFDFKNFFIKKLLDSLTIDRFYVSLLDKNDAIATFGENNENIYEKGMEERLEINGLDFSLRVFYDTTEIERSIFHIKVLIVFFCILSTVLSTLVIYFTQLLYREKSELKKANVSLSVEKSKAEKANRAKSAFLANMSHEIRTPLNGIIGTTSLMTETEMNQKLSKYVSRIESCGNILLNLINDILDISKIESGELKPESIPIELQNTVKEITDYMKFQAEKKGLELIVDYSKELYVQVNADSLRLKQILQNLLSNAIKFTEKGQVVLTVKPVKRIDDHVSVMFEVKDSGIGISPDKFDRLFKKFSQVDDSTTRRFGGTGLGLSICKNLVTLLGGNIHVTSEEGIGSKFWFTLPFKIPKESSLKREITLSLKNHEALRAFQGRRVLIVDDNLTSCKILEGYLTASNLEVFSIQSPEESLRLLQERTDFDFILLDYHMPEMNGLELAKRIREDIRTRDIAIILLSFDESLTMNSLDLVDRELIKPIYPVELLGIMLKVMRSKEKDLTRLD